MTNKKIRGGATIWARQTIDSDVFFWRPDKWFKIWFFIVNKVNHKEDTKLFKRGSNFMTYGEIANATKSNKNQIDGFMRYAKEQSMLTTQKTTRGMIVFVLKYDYFQDLNNYKTDTETETEPKHNRNITDTINKNDKNDNNEKKELAMPSIAGKELNLIIEKFKVVNPSYKRLFANKSQREALERLVKQYGNDKVGEMINYLPKIFGKLYAPRITTPCQLEMKLGDLISYIKERSQEKITLVDLSKK